MNSRSLLPEFSLLLLLVCLFICWNLKVGDKWGYIGRTGEMVIQSRFEAAAEFSEGLAEVKVGEKWGYIDKASQMVIPPQYSNTRRFSEGLAPVQKDFRKWGYIDRTGKVAIPLEYFCAFEFAEGLAAVAKIQTRRIAFAVEFMCEANAPRNIGPPLVLRAIAGPSG